jgi:hypothetical protein
LKSSWCKWDFEVAYPDLDELTFVGTTAEEKDSEELQPVEELGEVEKILASEPELTQVFLSLNREEASDAKAQRFAEIKSITISKINPGAGKN